MSKAEPSEPSAICQSQATPVICLVCRAGLCLRQQVINQALGNSCEMFCLNCLGRQSRKSGKEVLEGLKGYIISRQCFKTQWVKYADASDCPYPDSCFPDICFGCGSVPPRENLDLRGVACPMNFVKARLFIDKMACGQHLTILLDPGEPVSSVTSSMQAEGHKIIRSCPAQEGHHSLTICKG